MKKLNLLVGLINIFEICSILGVLIIAMGLQFWLNELPCPLCMLQRIGLLGIAFGYLLNLRFGFRPSHYAIALLSAVYTSFVALRQISLHVIPGTGAYGDPLFGFHLYTWVYVLCMVIIIVSTISLSIDRQYVNKRNVFQQRLINLTYLLTVLVITSNIISVIFECGPHTECPDNPVTYELMQHL